MEPAAPWRKEISTAYRDSIFHIVAASSDAQVRPEADLRKLIGAEERLKTGDRVRVNGGQGWWKYLPARTDWYRLQATTGAVPGNPRNSARCGLDWSIDYNPLHDR